MSRKLRDAMQARSPLARREAVAPVDLYGPAAAGEPASGQDHQPASGQTDRGADGAWGPPGAAGAPDKPAKPQVEKYTTHLRPATIKAVKRLALESDRKDYQVVQAALDEYLARQDVGND